MARLVNNILTVIRESLIRKMQSSIDGSAPGAISFHEISSLDHKAFDNPMESTTLVSFWDSILTIFPSAKLTEILCGSWSC